MDITKMGKKALKLIKERHERDFATLKSYPEFANPGRMNSDFWQAISILSKAKRLDMDLLITLFNAKIDIFNCLPEEMQKDEYILLLYFKHYFKVIDSKITRASKLNKKRAMEILEHSNGVFAYKYFDEKLKANKDILNLLLEKHGYTCPVHLIPQKAFNNKEFLSKFIECARDASSVINAKMINKDIALTLIKADMKFDHVYKCYQRFECILDYLKDEDFARKAVAIDGSIYGKCSESLRSDKKLFKTALRTYGDALLDAPECILNDKELLLSVLEQLSAESLDRINKGLASTKKSFSTVVEKADGFIALNVATEEMRKDKEVVLEAVKDNALALKLATSLRNDVDVVKTAMKRDAGSFAFASKDLIHDSKLYNQALKRVLKSYYDLFKDGVSSVIYSTEPKMYRVIPKSEKLYSFYDYNWLYNDYDKYGFDLMNLAQLYDKKYHKLSAGTKEMLALVRPLVKENEWLPGTLSSLNKIHA